MASFHRNPEISDNETSDTECRSSDTKNPLSSSPSNDGVKERYRDIKKSPNDERVYRGLLLDNNMKILLISDPITDKSAAALEVNVGYMSDPAELPGLAHFCEHMLFLGTEKYPDRNDFFSFLSQHGGKFNAETYTDWTNYHMDVSPDRLDDALDRFSQFFIKPLFTKSATELEMNAVDSEHDKNISDDTWRLDRLEKASADPDHPYSKFGTGNKQTLDTTPKIKGIDVHEALLTFYNTWYSSNIMALCVLGKESLDELEKMVVDRFAPVKNKSVEAPSWPEHPFKEEHFMTEWRIIPIKDIRLLNVVFPLPDLHRHFRSVPAHYVSHLLGHEGNGSLLSAMKNAGWSDSILAGERTAARGNCNFFNIAMDLTEEGINHIDDIITLLFQYINMLKRDKPLEWIFQEYNKIAKMDFQFKEKSTPHNYVNSMVRGLQKYPMEEVLIAQCLFTEWRPDLIDLVIDHLKPENIRVYVVSKSFEDIATESETWYGTKYKREPIMPETIEKWRNAGFNPELVCPTKNEFIPEDFSIRLKADNDGDDESCSVIDKYPVIIDDSPLMRVWFKQDDEFLLPKVDLLIDFSSPFAYLDPLNCNLMHMYLHLVKDSLNEYAYNASLAGLHWELNSSKSGITLAITGYRDKHRILLEKILDKVVNFTIDPKRYEIIKQHYIRTLKNFDVEQPYKHAVYSLAVLLSEQVWERHTLLDSCAHLSIKKLQEFVLQFITKMHVECLIHGNLAKSEAMETAELVETKLREPSCNNEDLRIIPLLTKQLLLNREICLENGSNYLYRVTNEHHKSSCTEVYYQTRLQSTEANMHLELLAQIIAEPCFNTLRTEEQLGYIVYSGVRRANGGQGLRIVVQSDRYPKFLDERIENFIDAMLERITNMSEEEFDKHKTSLATKRLEKPKKLRSLSAMFWGEISTQQYSFDRTNVEVAYLMTMTKDQIIEFFKEYIHGKSPTRRKLAVHVISMAEGGAGLMKSEELKNDEAAAATEESPTEESPTEIKDIIAFKTGQSLCPLVQPANGIPRKGQQSKL